jgi:hypothetical protein
MITYSQRHNQPKIAKRLTLQTAHVSFPYSIQTGALRKMTNKRHEAQTTEWNIQLEQIKFKTYSNWLFSVRMLYCWECIEI